MVALSIISLFYLDDLLFLFCNYFILSVNDLSTDFLFFEDVSLFIFHLICLYLYDIILYSDYTLLMFMNATITILFYNTFSLIFMQDSTVACLYFVFLE